MDKAGSRRRLFVTAFEVAANGSGSPVLPPRAIPKQEIIMTMRSNVRYISEIAGMWKTEESPDFRYFAKYDNEESTNPFWDENTSFFSGFSQLDLTGALEIACGTGRHAARIVDRATRLYLLDTSVDALRIARERFASQPHVEVIISADGESIPLADGSVSAVFSYDAMVHFEATTVGSYLFETARVLVPGGRALFHHSVYDKNPTGTFRQNPGWRNYMSQSLFAYLTSRAGLKIISSVAFNERGEAGMIDGLTLLERV
jgi:SAM-dependent methyltransferase